MNIEINRKKCVGCGLCAQICPEVFKMENNAAGIIENSRPVGSGALQAAEFCPANVIDIK